MIKKEVCGVILAVFAIIVVLLFAQLPYPGSVIKKQENAITYKKISGVLNFTEYVKLGIDGKAYIYVRKTVFDTISFELYEMTYDSVGKLKIFHAPATDVYYFVKHDTLIKLNTDRKWVRYD